MALPSFARQTITVVRPGVLIERGQEVPDWSTDAVTRALVTGCSVQPGNGSRDLDHRDGVMAAYTVFSPPGTPVEGTCRIELPGKSGQFTIMGEPMDQSYGLRVDHVMFALQRWK